MDYKTAHKEIVKELGKEKYHICCGQMTLGVTHDSQLAHQLCNSMREMGYDAYVELVQA